MQNHRAFCKDSTPTSQSSTPLPNASPHTRTRRPGQWCWLDTAVIATYGPRIGAHALAVYLVLASHANGRTQTCYPSIKTIARLTHLGRSTVKNALRTLKGEGLIQSTPQHDPQGDPTSNLYTLLDPTPETVASVAVVSEGGRSGDAPLPVTTHPTGRSPGDPKPSSPSQPEERTSNPSEGRSAWAKGKGKDTTQDETSSWDKSAVALPVTTDRPDDVLAGAHLSEDAYASLEAEATAALVAEGVKAFCIASKPVREAKMVALLLRRGPLTAVQAPQDTFSTGEESAPCAGEAAA
jgi:GntR family transcriptional regulator